MGFNIIWFKLEQVKDLEYNDLLNIPIYSSIISSSLYLYFC